MTAVLPRSPAPTARRPAWTQPDDVLSQLRRRWQTGAFLAAFAGGEPWQPLGLPVRGPSPGEAAERLGDVQAWADRWEHADRTLLRVEYKKIGGRLIGSNAVRAGCGSTPTTSSGGCSASGRTCTGSPR